MHPRRGFGLRLFVGFLLWLFQESCWGPCACADCSPTPEQEVCVALDLLPCPFLHPQFVECQAVVQNGCDLSGNDKVLLTTLQACIDVERNQGCVLDGGAVAELARCLAPGVTGNCQLTLEAMVSKPALGDAGSDAGP